MSAIKSKYKKTKTYQELRYILERKLERPHFTSVTKNGVTFRWNIRTGDWDNGNFTEEHLKSIFPENIYKLLTFENLELSPIKKPKLNWIEEIFGSKKDPIPDTFRILVNLEGVE